jgi:hypothetical protein
MGSVIIKAYFEFFIRAAGLEESAWLPLAMAVCKESNPGRTEGNSVDLGLHTSAKESLVEKKASEEVAQWVVFAEHAQSPGSPGFPGSHKPVKADVAGAGNPSIQETREKDQKFKAILCYIQFEANVGYKRPCLF